jgi:hypothetical protein
LRQSSLQIVTVSLRYSIHPRGSIVINIRRNISNKHRLRVVLTAIGSSNLF